MRPTLTLRVPSQTGFLGLVHEVTLRMAESAGFGGRTQGRLAEAVDEAATHAIEHAYGGRPDRVVELRYDDRGARLAVEIVDTGAMADPRTAPGRSGSRAAGGPDATLMEKIMDSVTFRRSARRNVCCLVKHKASTPEGE